MFKSIRKSGIVVLGALMLASCAAQPRYHDHDDHRYTQRRCNSCGTIEDIDQVWIAERASGGGAVLGAIIGGVVGNQIGKGRGRDAATVAGAVAGGVIGHRVERNRRGEQRAYRFEVSLDDGRWAEVTQLDHHGLREGDRVMIRRKQVVRIN